MGKVIPFEKTKALEEAVRKQAANLDPAQREFVKAQFEHYKWNEEQIANLEVQYEAVSKAIDAGDYESSKELKMLLDEKGSAHRQRHQLIAEQGTLFSHIMRWLKGTASDESPLDEFMS